MLSFEKKSFLAPMVLMGLSVSALSEPTLSSFEVTDTNPDGEGALFLEIKGDGFGEKEIAPPILWAFGSDVREIGEKIDYTHLSHEESLNDLAASEHPWGNVTRLFFDHEGTRHSGIDYAYQGRGNNSGPHIDRVSIIENIKDEVDFSQLFFSARYNVNRFNDRWMAIRFNEDPGNFALDNDGYSRGDRLDVRRPEYYGWPTSVDFSKPIDGQVYAIDTRQASTFGFMGRRHQVATIEVIGEETPFESDVQSSFFYEGAEAIADGEWAHLHEDFLNYETFRPNEIRPLFQNSYFQSFISADQLDSNYRLQMRPDRTDVVTVDGNDNVIDRPMLGNEVNLGRGWPSLARNRQRDWDLVETFIDGSSPDDILTQIRLNNEHVLDFSGHSADGNHSFIPEKIGWYHNHNDTGAYSRFIGMKLNFGEIYIDNTPQRVLLSNRQVFLEVQDNIEYQIPYAWDDGAIGFEVNTGDLNTNQTLYAYVFNDKGEVNYNGMPVDIDEALLPAPERDPDRRPTAPSMTLE